MQKIDNGYTLVTPQKARSLNAGKLPAAGYEALVQHEGKWHFLARTQYQGKTHWSIRPTPWRMENGRMVLG